MTEHLFVFEGSTKGPVEDYGPIIVDSTAFRVPVGLRLVHVNPCPACEESALTLADRLADAADKALAGDMVWARTTLSDALRAYREARKSPAD